MKLFNVPITHEYIQNLTSFDLEFIEMSTALDNPKLRDKILNTIYDEEYDDFEKEVDSEELTKEEKKMMEEIMSKHRVSQSEEDNSFIPLSEDIQQVGKYDPDDWEEVD